MCDITGKFRIAMKFIKPLIASFILRYCEQKIYRNISYRVMAYISFKFVKPFWNSKLQYTLLAYDIHDN